MIFLLMVCMQYNTSFAQDVSVIKFKDLRNEIEMPSDTILVINFWATWCKPCVKELPCFYELNSNSKTLGTKTLLVSLDFKRQLDATLKPFLSKRGQGPEVVLLDEPDYDLWINKVDPNWTGAIPATLLVNRSTGMKIFHEGEVTCDELNGMIHKIKNQ
ncbi:MAG: TlpA family protein disulfide reductase [Bacteroidota bacterium]